MKLERDGFTLVELIITMAVGMMVLGVVLTFFWHQQKVSFTENAVVEMQQGARTGLSLMTREIRMAGYDPDGILDMAIQTANADEIVFNTAHVDSVTNTLTGNILRIRYAVGGDGNLGRATVVDAPGTVTPFGVLQTIAYNIDVLNLVYLDADGGITADLADIRAVQITLVSRSGDTVSNFFLGGSDAQVAYKNLQGEDIFTPDPGQRFRRTVLYNTSMCRNLGLGENF